MWLFAVVPAFVDDTATGSGLVVAGVSLAVPGAVLVADGIFRLVAGVVLIFPDGAVCVANLLDASALLRLTLTGNSLVSRGLLS